MTLSAAFHNGGYGSPVQQYPGGRASTSPRLRITIFLAVASLHLALLFLCLTGLFDRPDGTARSGLAGGELSVFTLSDVASASNSAAGDTAGARLPMDGASEREVSEREKMGSEVGDRTGDASLRDAIAGAMADDPVAGGDWLSYEALLRRHIARHSQYPDKGGGRGRTGVVVVRFNVDRDGLVVDARVLTTQGASLDEAALAALWRAEPLPGVPAALPTPLEIDVPIDFRMRG